jgi:hypothetical protein
MGLHRRNSHYRPAPEIGTFLLSSLPQSSSSSSSSSAVSRWYQRNYRRLLSCLPFSSILAVRFGLRSQSTTRTTTTTRTIRDVQNRNKGHKWDAQTFTLSGSNGESSTSTMEEADGHYRPALESRAKRSNDLPSLSTVWTINFGGEFSQIGFWEKVFVCLAGSRM